MNETENMTIADAVAELEQAVTAYKDASASEDAARSVCTAARNRLNRAQKAVDALIANLKQSAPRDSNWASEKQRVAVP